MIDDKLVPALDMASVTTVNTVADLAKLLRQLRRRQAHRRRDSELTYRELTAKTGWSIGTIAGYFTGRTLPPTDRFDILIGLLDATPAEQRILATLRDNVAEKRRPQPQAGPTWPIPRQLPPDIFSFAGRDAELAQLDSLLGPNRTVVVSALSGTAGIGKTALAVHWAHRVAARFSDGQLYVNLRGFDPGGPPVTAGDAVRGFLEAFGVEAQRIPHSVEAQAALYRSLLADRRVLVLLDNARDADHVRPLLPGSSGCLTLVTSRHHLAGLIAAEGARPLLLDLLTPDEATRLLSHRLGPQRIEAEPQATAELIERCARLPLALTVIAARAATRPAIPLSTLADELRETQGGLDPFVGDDATIDVRAVFSHSYTDLSPAAAAMFRLLAIHPGPDIAVPAAASLAGTTVAQARARLTELVNANLVNEHVPGRFTFHDLLRAYAAELMRSHLDEGQPGLRRMLDHYLYTANAAALMIYAHRDPIPLVTPDGTVTPQAFHDQTGAKNWYAAEHAALMSIIDLAAANGLAEHTWQLAWAIGDVLDWRGHWHDLVTVQQTGMLAAQRISDAFGEAHTLRVLARAYIRLGRYDEAARLLEKAVALFEHVEDRVGEANSHIALARVYEEHGRHGVALRHSQRALELFRAAGHHSGQARSLNAVGWYHALLENYPEAIDCCEQALALHRENGSHLGQAPAWDSLGYAYQHLGHHEEALACYQNAIDLYREVGDRFHEGDTLVHLGDNHHEAGASALAHDSWRRALEIFTDLNHPASGELRRKLASI
ncbi:MAG TPA: tetratricopeptide repeat protein [Candidatus Limnocylindrales bacterium]|nr:tetratricopeptide repeat protein [Candidatus Limnocylindrales bacterium]